MQPPDPDERSHVEFVARRALTFGGRIDVPVGNRLSVVTDVRWVPRGDGASFRQTYGYFGDYVEVAPRLSLRTRGTGLWGVISAGPAVAIRVRERNSASLFSGPEVRFPEFGPMTRFETGVLLTAGVVVPALERVRVTVEVQYHHGLTNIHSPGSAGTVHDPHGHCQVDEMRA